MGDVPTLTVAEYRGRPWQQRLGYRLFRNPLVMFGIGPLYAMVLAPRWVSRSDRPHIRRSVIATNLALVLLVGSVCWLIGWQEYLLVQVPTVLLAGATGVWLFYVQHQFEDAYWQSSERWSYADAALRGSSYLRLPKVLQFFTVTSLLATSGHSLQEHELRSEALGLPPAVTCQASTTRSTVASCSSSPSSTRRGSAAFSAAWRASRASAAGVPAALLSPL